MEALAADLNSAKSAQRARAYRSDIDGLRGIAVLAVVLVHAGVPWFKGGFVGVDIFFVISGYLIGAHVYSDTSRGSFSLADFYRKRAKRILPALLILLLVCYALAVLLLSPIELVKFSRHSIATILSVSNIRAWHEIGYFAPEANQNPLLMTWSLGVEEQFYLFFPLIMLALGKRPLKLVFIVISFLAATSMIFCIVVSQKSPSTAFFLLPFRAWELLLGVLLAVYGHFRQTHPHTFPFWLVNAIAALGLALVGIGIFSFGPHIVFPGYAAAVPAFGSLMLLGSAESWINQHVLPFPPLNYVGRVSYSFYLWHWPLISFAHIVAAGPVPLKVSCGIAALSFLIACASYRWIEQYFRKSTTPRNRLLIKYAMYCVIVMAPAIIFRQTKGLPGRFGAFPAGSLTSVEPFDPCGTTTDLTMQCADLNDPRPAIALIGDSHAAVLAETLREDAIQSDFKFYQMTRYTCAPLQKVTSTFLSRNQEDICLSYNARVLALLKNDARIKVVVVAAYWSQPEIEHGSYVRDGMPLMTINSERSEQIFREGLTATVAELVASGKQVLLVKDVPIFTFDPLRRIQSHFIPLRSLLTTGHFPSGALATAAPVSETFEAAEQRADEVLDRVATSSKVHTLDLRSRLCAEQACEYVRNTQTLYLDNNHLSHAGSRQALSNFRLDQ